MKYFFSDIDNTLIYSHRHSIPEEKICVEKLAGREQSFMSAASLAFFLNTPELTLIPVTTRTIEQYQRLDFLSKVLRCKRALVCNGGILLENGLVNSEWLMESMQFMELEIAELHKAEAVMKKICHDSYIHNAEGILLYAKVPEPEAIRTALRKEIDGALLTTFSDGRKVYCTPCANNKGAALQRYSEKYKCAIDIAAGDGVADLSMLMAADVALAPSKIGEMITHQRLRQCPNDAFFANYICTELKNLL